MGRYKWQCVAQRNKFEGVVLNDCHDTFHARKALADVLFVGAYLPSRPGGSNLCVWGFPVIQCLVVPVTTMPV